MERWNTWNRVEAACEAMDALFLALGNRKGALVDALFGKLSVEQRQDWCRRSPHNFWLALDYGNRQRAMDMALAWYGSDDTKQAIRLEKGGRDAEPTRPLLQQIEEIMGRWQEAAQRDAGFDGGEFSGPECDRKMREELDALGDWQFVLNQAPQGD